MRIFRADPLADPAPLVRRVYAYAAYRLGDGPDAEDVTSETFARALRHRDSYDPRRGEPAAWLVGIARRVIADTVAARPLLADAPEIESGEDLAGEALERLELARAVATLDARERELIALRYGADLTARQIARVIGSRTNTVEVALHRALRRLRLALDPAAADDDAKPVALKAVRIEPARTVERA